MTTARLTDRYVFQAFCLYLIGIGTGEVVFSILGTFCAALAVVLSRHSED